MVDKELLQAMSDMMDSKLEPIKKDIGELKNDVGKLKNDVVELKNDVGILKTKVTNVELTLENDISKKIDIIGEGHDFLKMRLNEALQMEQKREKMELELINLRMDINKIKNHLDIA